MLMRNIATIAICLVLGALAHGAPLEQATTRPAALNRSLTPATPDTPARYQRKFNTFAHQMLDLEAEVDEVPDAKYQLLDTILADAKSRVVYDATEKVDDKRRTQTLEAFATIDEVLTDHNVIYPPGEWILTLAEGLTPQKLTETTAVEALPHAHSERRRQRIKDHIGEDFYFMDCDILSFMYMAVGEVMGFELNLVEAPRHNFIRYHLDANDYISWETTIPAQIRNDRQRYSHLNELAVRERTFLASMTHDETLGYFYMCRGNRCQKLNPPNYEQAAKDFERAIALYPQAPGSRNELAWLYVAYPGFSPGPHEEALQLSLRSLSIDPGNSEYMDTLATVYADLGDFKKAVLFAEDAIKNFSYTSPGSEKSFQRYKKRLEMFRRGETYLQNGGDPKHNPPATRATTQR